MKKIVIFLMVLMASVLFAQNGGEISDNSEKTPLLTLEEINKLEDEKGSPGLAFFLSFLLVGGGQFYNGDIAAGVVHLLVAGAGGSIWIGGAVGAVKNRADYIVNRRYSMVSAIGAGVVLFNFLWSMIDAPLTAMVKNKEIDEKIRQLKVSKKNFNEETVKFAIGPSFGEKSIDGIFLGLSYGFK